MDPVTSADRFRKNLLVLAALSDRSLNALLKLFTLKNLNKDDYFLRAGEYPLQLAFVEQGVIHSFYTDQLGKHFSRGIYVAGMYLVPLPPFIYRQPSFLSFQAVCGTTLFQARYSDVHMMAKNDIEVKNILRAVIDREWIVAHELHDAGLHVYNKLTRFELFQARYGQYVDDIPADLIASYLNIPPALLEKYRKNKSGE